MRFRKKPVEIEAVQVGQISIIGHVFPQWLLDARANGIIFLEGEQLKIKTLEGVMTADFGDWIIKGVKGELYPCKSDIFAATYDPVE